MNKSKYPLLRRQTSPPDIFDMALRARRWWNRDNRRLREDPSNEHLKANLQEMDTLVLQVATMERQMLDDLRSRPNDLLSETLANHVEAENMVEAGLSKSLDGFDAEGKALMADGIRRINDVLPLMDHACERFRAGGSAIGLEAFLGWRAQRPVVTDPPPGHPFLHYYVSALARLDTDMGWTEYKRKVNDKRLQGTAVNGLVFGNHAPLEQMPNA